jgi:hypothetical protein
MATATKKNAAKSTKARADDWLKEPATARKSATKAKAKPAAKKAPAKKAPTAKSKAAAKAPTAAALRKMAANLGASDVGDDEEDLEWGEVKKPGAKKTGGRKYAKLGLKPIKVPARTVGTGKTARKVKPRKLSATQVLASVVEQTELPRADVKLVLATLSNIVKASLMPGAVGGAVVPGIGAMMRKDIAAKKMPAVKRGTVIEKRNPRTGETTKFKHPGQKAYVKPGRTKVRSIPLAALRRAALGTE